MPNRTAANTPPFEQILGIRFFQGTAREAVEFITRVGGYTVVPAAPALADIERDEAYRRAVTSADLAIADSGFMVLLWRFLRRRKVTRISGLRYLQALFEQLARSPGRGMFLIVPNESAREKAIRWLSDQQFKVTANQCYLAPIYGEDVTDVALLVTLNATRPAHVIVGIGGGTQEKLGMFLRDHLSYRPAIHCIGAALGFLTGDQPPIPNWADRFYLGWLLRVIREPRRFTGRYARAFVLSKVMWRYGEKQPEGKVGS